MKTPDLDGAGQNRDHRRRDSLSAPRNWVPFLLPAAYVLWTIGPTVTAPLTLWDHWIADLVGSDGRMTMQETVDNIRLYSPEVGAPRFRPLYWVLYFGEICFYGSWALPWRLTNLAAALLCGILLYTTARRWVSSPAASVVALSFFSGNQCEAWIRLGLQEAYGMPLLLAGLAWIAVRLKAGRSAPSDLLIGYLLLLAAGFVKESFAIVLPVSLVCVHLILPRWRDGPPNRSKTLRGLQIVALALPVLGAMVVVGFIAVRFLAHGHVYGQATTYAQVEATAVNSVVTYARDTWFWLPVLLAAGAWTFQPRLAPALRLRRVAQLCGLSLLGFALLLAPQWFVYGAMGNMDYRYLMPGNLAAVVALGMALYFLSEALDGLAGPVRVALLAVALASATVAAFATASRARLAAIQTRDGGQAFQADVNRIVRLDREHADLPIVFVAESVGDFEAVIGVNRFLTPRLASGHKPFLLVTTPGNEASAYERDLLQMLTRISREGEQGFTPLADISSLSPTRIEVRFKPPSLYLGDPFAEIHWIR